MSQIHGSLSTYRQDDQIAFQVVRIFESRLATIHSRTVLLPLKKFAKKNLNSPIDKCNVTVVLERNPVVSATAQHLLFKKSEVTRLNVGNF